MLTVDVESLASARPDDREGSTRLETVARGLAELTDDMHRLAYTLHPSILDHLGLAAALRRYADELAERHQLDVRLSDRGFANGLGVENISCLYRIAQESLSNVVKHSKSRRVTVRLAGTPEAVRLSVRDSGEGFDVEAARRSQTLGLTSMEERARLVGGTFSIAISSGTRHRRAGHLPAARAGRLTSTRWQTASREKPRSIPGSSQFPRRKRSRSMAKGSPRKEERNMAISSRSERALTPIRREMERVFDEIGKGRWPAWPAWMEEEQGLSPALEVGETDDEFFVKAQVPGMKREDIEIELSESALMMKGEAKEEKEEKKKNYYRREFSYGRFARTVPIPSGADTSKASAELKDGVLNVHIPKTEESKKHSVKLDIH